MFCQDDITSLKTDIDEKIGQKIIVKGSLGRRSKTFSKEAIIEKDYPTFFIIKFEEDHRNTSYSYTDILTRTVEVQVLNSDNTYMPLIPPVEETRKKRVKV